MPNNVWSLIIKPKSKWYQLNLHEIWESRYLLQMFVWRDFVSQYKQTILGPLWFFIQPVISTIVFTVIFGQVGKLPTDGLPQILFYMCGIVAWNYFADCINKTANTFTTNSNLFGKVYFPRIIVPLSIVISSMFKFLIQFFLFLMFMLYYKINGADIYPNIYIAITPLLLFIMGGMGLGMGIIISSLTTKYRDLQHLVVFGVQLLMFISPIVLPVSAWSEKYRWIVTINPMTSVIETFKYAYLGVGTFDMNQLLFSGVFMLIILMLALVIFNNVEKNFMDTV